MSEIVPPNILSYIWRRNNQYTEKESLKKARNLIQDTYSFTKPINVDDDTIKENIKKFQHRFCIDCLYRKSIADLTFIQWQMIKSISTPENDWPLAVHPHHARNKQDYCEQICKQIEKKKEVKKIFEDIGYDLTKNIGGSLVNAEKPPVWILLDDGRKHDNYDYFKYLFDLNCLSFAKDSIVVKNNDFWRNRFSTLHENLSKRYLWFNYFALIKSMFKLENSNTDHNVEYKFVDAEFVEFYSEEPGGISGLYVKLYQKYGANLNEVTFDPDFPINLGAIDKKNVDAKYKKYIDLRKRKNLYCIALFIEEIFRLGAIWFCYFALKRISRGERCYGYKLFRSNYQADSNDKFDPFVNITGDFPIRDDIASQNSNLPTFSFFIPAKKFKTNFHGRDFFTLIVGECEKMVKDIKNVNGRVREYIKRTDLASIFFDS